MRTREEIIEDKNKIMDGFAGEEVTLSAIALATMGFVGLELQVLLDIRELLILSSNETV